MPLNSIGDFRSVKIEVGSIDINRQKLNLCQLCDELYGPSNNGLKSQSYPQTHQSIYQMWRISTNIAYADIHKLCSNAISIRHR